MSRPQFDVTTSFFFSTTDSWSQLPFSCCDLKLFVFSLSCRDMGFRSLSNRLFSLLKFMSRPQKHVATSFLLILAQPRFLVTTVSSQFSFFHGSSLKKCVMTEWLPFYVVTSFLCRDTLSVVSHFDLWS